MPVQGIQSFTLEVPDLAVGESFYAAAGLDAVRTDGSVILFCRGQDQPVGRLVEGPRKRLHHLTLRATELSQIGDRVALWGGEVIPAPEGHPAEGLWVRDGHGLMIRLAEVAAEPMLRPALAFEINSPGSLKRVGRSAMLRSASYPRVRPRRLGHVMLFSPDVPRSVDFMVEALGMGLADRAEDVIAFTCARKNSDHHVVAFAKSPDIGFHHASFEVGDPDEVGRAGHELHGKIGKGGWGFGRHTIGSNYFYYIQDPWGSWFEYYVDMDHIEDYSTWTPTNYGMEDSLSNWGPPVPDDFVHNYEVV